MRVNAGDRSRNNKFAQVPDVEIPRSTLDLSHGHMTTFDSGYLIPVMWEEVLPGDTFNVRMASFIRLATPLKPFMDNLYMDTFAFFVPNRLLWDNWQRFMGERDPDPDSSIDFLTPKVTTPAIVGPISQSLWDYMGVPLFYASQDVLAFPFRAYNLIYKEWFRDENLIDSPAINKGDGPDAPGDYQLFRRGKRKDYFTSALIAPQKGDAIELPLGGTAPLSGIGQVVGDGAAPQFTTGTMTSTGISGAVTSGTPASNTVMNWTDPNLEIDLSQAGLVADLATATAATVNAIREAFQAQRFLEREARGGTRYTEILRSFFGVVSPDQRLMRPEYLGGGTSRVTVHPVAQTSTPSTGITTTPQGNLAAFATGGAQGQGFSKSFVEHGIVMVLVSVRADLKYQQGLRRQFSRNDRFDYYWPPFATLGEQAILSKEIYADGSAADDDIFGYIPRYDEYRYKPGQISGKFRSDDPQSLDIWHLAQDFTTRPVLNESFINEDPPVDRVIAVPSEPQFLADFWFSVTAARPMPVFAVPGLIDHF